MLSYAGLWAFVVLLTAAWASGAAVSWSVWPGARIISCSNGSDVEKFFDPSASFQSCGNSSLMINGVCTPVSGPFGIAEAIRYSTGCTVESQNTYTATFTFDGQEDINLASLAMSDPSSTTSGYTIGSIRLSTIHENRAVATTCRGVAPAYNVRLWQEYLPYTQDVACCRANGNFLYHSCQGDADHSWSGCSPEPYACYSSSGPFECWRAIDPGEQWKVCDVEDAGAHTTVKAEVGGGSDVTLWQCSGSGQCSAAQTGSFDAQVSLLVGDRQVATSKLTASYDQPRAWRKFPYASAGLPSDVVSVSRDRGSSWCFGSEEVKIDAGGCVAYTLSQNPDAWELYEPINIPPQQLHNGLSFNLLAASKQYGVQVTIQSTRYQFGLTMMAPSLQSAYILSRIADFYSTDGVRFDLGVVGKGWGTLTFAVDTGAGYAIGKCYLARGANKIECNLPPCYCNNTVIIPRGEGQSGSVLSFKVSDLGSCLVRTGVVPNITVVPNPPFDPSGGSPDPSSGGGDSSGSETDMSALAGGLGGAGAAALSALGLGGLAACAIPACCGFAALPLICVCVVCFCVAMFGTTGAALVALITGILVVKKVRGSNTK